VRRSGAEIEATITVMTAATTMTVAAAEERGNAVIAELSALNVGPIVMVIVKGAGSQGSGGVITAGGKHAINGRRRV